MDIFEEVPEAWLYGKGKGQPIYFQNLFSTISLSIESVNGMLHITYIIYMLFLPHGI